MGQKTNPIGFRVGITRKSDSRWYADKKHFGRYLVEDNRIRRYIKQNLFFAGIARVEIERTEDEVEVIIHSARPGVVIGRHGQEVMPRRRKPFRFAVQPSSDFHIPASTSRQDSQLTFSIRPATWFLFSP